MQPWAILGPSTTWGREACGRISVALNAGLSGDALGFSVESSRLVCWKPAFGDRLVAAVSCTTPTQMATARPGVFPLLAEREPSEVPVTTVAGQRLDRIRVHSREQDDDPDALCSARVVIGVGHGVDPADYPLLEPLKTALGAELAGTRKVTDAGWLPHSRQIGLTGHNVAPELYVAIGIQGKLNHTIGVHQAGAILAINTDPDAPIFRCADVGIVADWRLVVADLTAQLRERAVTRAAG
jgi:electron transfer flavoprotein alpha subunit